MGEIVYRFYNRTIKQRLVTDDGDNFCYNDEDDMIVIFMGVIRANNWAENDLIIAYPECDGEAGTFIFENGRVIVTD